MMSLQVTYNQQSIRKRLLASYPEVPDRQRLHMIHFIKLIDLDPPQGNLFISIYMTRHYMIVS